MLEIDGIPPVLIGHTCEALICQQYWYKGELGDEADVVFLKVDGHWYQLYFDNGILFWRTRNEAPVPSAEDDGVFSFPLIDLGMEYGIQGGKISNSVCEEILQGAKVTIDFAQHGIVEIVNAGDKTSIRHCKS